MPDIFILLQMSCTVRGLPFIASGNLSRVSCACLVCRPLLPPQPPSPPWLKKYKPQQMSIGGGKKKSETKSTDLLKSLAKETIPQLPLCLKAWGPWFREILEIQLKELSGTVLCWEAACFTDGECLEKQHLMPPRFPFAPLLFYTFHGEPGLKCRSLLCVI